MDQDVLNAKRQLDAIYNDPPQPLNSGCTRKCLDIIFRTLQCFGIYFDGNHYQRVSEMFTYPKEELKNSKRMNNQVRVIGDILNRHSSTDNVTVTNHSTTGTVDNRRADNMNPNQRVPSDNYVHRLIRKSSGIIDERQLRDILCSEKSCLNSKQAYHEDSSDKNDPNFRKFSLSSFMKAVVSFRMYNFLVTSILWANFARCAIYIGDPRISLASGAGSILWYLMCCLNATVLMVSCWSKSHFSAFFINWNLLYKDMTTRRLGLRGNDNNKSLKYFVLALILMTIFNVFCNVFIMVADDQFSLGMNLFMYVDGQRSLHSIVISSVVITFCSSAWIGPVIFIVTLCRHVVGHFKQFKHVLKMHILAAGDQFPPHFAELRERHLVMCNLTAILDRYMRVAFAVIFSNKITACCSLLYQIINFHLDNMVLAISLFWVAAGVFIVGIITYHASSVNISMHSLMDELHTLKTKSVTQEQQVQLQLFLSKVNGPDLGFTVLGLITVKRELMLTLIGLYITYGVVLVQFK